MKVEAALQGVLRLYLDTAPVIYYVQEAADQLRIKLRCVFNERCSIETGDGTAGAGDQRVGGLRSRWALLKLGKNCPNCFWRNLYRQVNKLDQETHERLPDTYKRVPDTHERL